MNQNLHVLILKLYKNEQKYSVSSGKFFISHSALSRLCMFWKMGKFENFMAQITKAKFEVKN